MAKAQEKAGYVPRQKAIYTDVVRKKMVDEFGYKNAMQVPVIEKIVINMGVGEATSDTKKVAVAAEDLSLISGQKPVITKARNAIASFKVRENMPIGCKVTLRKNKMYEFIDRLVNIALPRVRDFVVSIRRFLRSIRTELCWIRTPSRRTIRRCFRNDSIINYISLNMEPEVTAPTEHPATPPLPHPPLAQANALSFSTSKRLL